MAIARDFTSGPILRAIVNLALPIMGTAFIQMGYNLADVFWIGQEGSESAAAVGAAGFFVWLANAFAVITKTGAEISISHALGANNVPRAYRFARHAVVMSLLFGILYAAALLMAKGPLISFFKFSSNAIMEDAQSYLLIVAFGMPFTFLNATYFGLYNGFGYSQTPFWANSAGLGLNIILDPILIRGWLGFPALGVRGAALATVFSQLVVSLIFLAIAKRPSSRFHHLLRGFRPNRHFAWRLLKLGTPVGMQNALFACISMIVARLVAQWSDLGVAVQTTGAQIEAISYMTASGFASALSSYVGQNFAAKRFDRIRKGYIHTLALTASAGVVATILFVFWGGEIFGFFIPESNAMREGGVYLRIMGYSQLFMVLEIMSTGTLNGMGRTLPPAICSLSFNALRIPLALWLGSYALSGIWWAITISSILKGVTIAALLLVALRRYFQKLPQPKVGISKI